MAALRMLLALAALAGRAHPLTPRAGDATLSLEPQLQGGFHLVIIRGEESETLAHIGRTLPSSYLSAETADGAQLTVGGANLTLRVLYDEQATAHGIKVSWHVEGHTRLEDCFDFGTKHWYGGPMQVEQLYPVERARQVYGPYYSKEQDNGAISERYWLNSAGQYVYVHPEVPLFVDYHNVAANHLCFGAQVAEPYSSLRSHTTLSYDIWLLSDVKVAHQHAVANYLGKPSDIVDYRMVQHPIWSTWAQFSKDINEEKVLAFANEIVDYGFSNSQFEIDDLWEVCYGSLTVDEAKFPNFTRTVQDLKSLGFRVTIWVHPFINKGCDPWYNEALENGYFVLGEDGSPDTSWWNDNGTTTGHVDFTNPAAAAWWSGRVRSLLGAYDIDSVKFDAGEASFLPQRAVMGGDVELQPHAMVQAYVTTCAEFGAMVEVRAGFSTQHLPVFVRMVDRDSIWGFDNGLPTLLTTALQMSLAGYPLVLPDMIGGNGFNLNHEQADVPDKELFIRWVQANTFLPAMQYSYVPWNFDNETVEISRRYTQLHASEAPRVLSAMRAAVAVGDPVTRPLWWLDPNDEEALVIGDEFLLGDDVLVAPVLERGARSRDVYLPTGTWLDANTAELHQGPLWLRDYPAPLDTLPYFIREVKDSAATAGVSAILVAAMVAVQLL